MVKTIQPEEYSSSARSTPRKSPPKNNEIKLRTKQPAETPKSVDVQMVAQHREIERLVESRQRLHTIKDQIASLHQSMTTPTMGSENDLNNETKTYAEKLNESRNLRPIYQLEREESASESDLYDFEDQSEEIASQIPIQPRMKQSVS